MPGLEYKVLPAPSKGRKGRGVKSGEARFAHALELMMNELAAEGWQYLRSDMLPHEERQGIRSSHITYRSVLVFCREVPGDAVAEEQKPDPIVPARITPVPPAVPAPVVHADVEPEASEPEQEYSIFERGGEETNDPDQDDDTSPERFS